MQMIEGVKSPENCQAVWANCVNCQWKLKRTILCQEHCKVQSKVFCNCSLSLFTHIEYTLSLHHQTLPNGSHFTFTQSETHLHTQSEYTTGAIDDGHCHKDTSFLVSMALVSFYRLVSYFIHTVHLLHQTHHLSL